MPLPRPHNRVVLLAALTTGALAIAGCGSSHSTGTAADPAMVVPASAPLYAGADVRPGGAEQAAALAAGRALTHQANPYLRLLAALRTPGSATLRFQHDIAPWLGPHAGVFLTSLHETSALTALLEHVLLASQAAAFPFSAQGVQGAIVLDTSDVGKARSFLNAQASRAGAHASSYRGTSYMLTAGGVAFGVVDRFAVLGSDTGFRDVVDTALGGSSLVQASGYKRLLASAPTGTLAHVFTSPAATSEGGLLALLAGSRQANISLVPANGSLTVYADSPSSSTATAGGLLASGAEGAQALSELPGNSWLAAGLAHLGQTLGQDVAGLRELATLGSSVAGGVGVVAPAAGTLSLSSLVEGLLAPLAALSQGSQTLTSWMGSGGLYASGAGVLELKGAIVIESRDPALSRAAVARVGALLHHQGDLVQNVKIAGTDAAVEARVTGLPLPLDIADGRTAAGKTRFVLGLGEPSVTEALSPASTLAAAASRSAAASTLGEGIEPNVIFQVPTLLSLLEGVGLGEDPTLSKLLPLLRGVTSVTAGGRASGETDRFKLVLSLAPQG